MNEKELLDRIFDGPKWRNRYYVDWCEMCDTAVIACLEENCHGTTCNCGGCKVCSNDQDYQDFDKAKTRIWQYLNDDERKVYDKARWLKKYILESLKDGEYEINWRRMKEEGHLCGIAEQMFAKEIKESYDKYDTKSV